MSRDNSQFDTLQTAYAWSRDGLRVALATVVETWGSAPRGIGANFVVNEAGQFAGSVSGGCIEPLVVSESIDILEDATPRLLTYGVSDEQAQEVRLACGGTIRIFVEPLGDAELLRAFAQDRPLVRAIDLNTGEWTARVGDNSAAFGTLTADAVLEEMMATALSTGQSQNTKWQAREIFIAAFPLPPRLIIIGAVHVAAKLAPMAALAGFDVHVVEPRPAFFKNHQLRDIRVLNERVGPAVVDLKPDAGTALVTLAHDPLYDDPALIEALNSPAFYIGCLGSKRTHAKRLERLADKGFYAADLDRLHGPVGLDISARQPGEIAASILAEIIAVRNSKRLHAGELP